MQIMQSNGKLIISNGKLINGSFFLRIIDGLTYFINAPDANKSEFGDNYSVELDRIQQVNLL